MKVISNIILALFLALSARCADQQNCFTLLVGKNASSDGYVIMGHNEDDGPPQVVNHYKVPRQTFPSGSKYKLIGGGKLEQVAETWSYIWSEMPGMLFSDSFLNEWGVCIASDNCPSREDKLDLTDGGISWDLRRLIAQRAKSAREGVHLAGQWVERFGYEAPGRTYIISDPNEGWFFCAVRGRRWLAARVSDDQVAVISNRYAVHQVNLKDTLNFLSAADVVKYAQKRGWYQQKQGAFDFAAVYSDPVSFADSSNFCRQWSGLSQFAAEPIALDLQLPFSVVPKEPVSVEDAMAVLRNHYEWTELYRATETGSPHDPSIGTICNETTQTSFVVQLRADKPLEIGLVYWVTLGPPCTSAYLPFHFGLDHFPRGYTVNMSAYSPNQYAEKVSSAFSADPREAFWTFSNFHQQVNSRYGQFGTDVRARIEQFQKTAFDLQKPYENPALVIYLSDPALAKKMLLNYTDGLYFQALESMNTVLYGP